MAVGFHVEIDDEGRFWVHAESGVVGQASCLVEHIQVAEGELLVNLLVDCNDAGGVAVLVVADGHCAWADVALNGEVDCTLLCLNLDCLWKGVELFADLGEFSGRNFNGWSIFGVWDSEVFGIESD